MFYKTNCISINIILVLILFLPFLTPLSENYEKDVPHCLQERPGVRQECEYLSQDFCKNIECEPIENCDQNEKVGIVQNIVGRGCCPACVHFKDEGESCKPRSRLDRCRNGLFCDPSSQKCSLPPNPRRCMTEVHNRRYVSLNKMSFYVEGTERTKRPMYYEIKYAQDIDLPSCSAQSGKYEPKQCRGSKCFCVNPETGKFTFGLTVKNSADGSSDNMTCECAEQFRQKLSTVDRTYMEHYAQIHAKCDSAGNYDKLECINATCFCVDEKTGRPDPEKTAIFGALMTLPCFDKDKSEALHTKDSNKYYLNECERQLMRTQQLSLHFTDKGTDLIGLDKISCSFDGKFAPRQCKPEMCNCVKPDDANIAMPINYGVDRIGGKDSSMECRCAREVFYATIEKKGYDRLQCDGLGNFKAYQAFDNGKKTYCVDEDGSRISEIVSSACFDQFVKDIDMGLQQLREFICNAMRRVLTEQVIEDKDPNKKSYYKFDKGIKDYAPMKEPPSYEDRYCANSQLQSECSCDIVDGNKQI